MRTPEELLFRYFVAIQKLEDYLSILLDYWIEHDIFVNGSSIKGLPEKKLSRIRKYIIDGTLGERSTAISLVLGDDHEITKKLRYVNILRKRMAHDRIQELQQSRNILTYRKEYERGIINADVFREAELADEKFVNEINSELPKIREVRLKIGNLLWEAMQQARG